MKINVYLIALLLFSTSAWIRTTDAQTVDWLQSGDLSAFVDAKGKPISRSGWTNENGVLKHTKGGGNLFYREPVGDFILSFEFNIAPGGNSGIKYRVKQFGNSWLGCEFQVQDDKNQPYNLHATGSLYAVYEPSKSKTQNPPGQWNRGKIIVQGHRIQHWLNDVLVVDAEAGSVEWNRRVEASKFKPHEGFGQNPVGRIMIQDHGTRVSYRNMQLTRLDAVAQESAIAAGDCATSSACCNGIPARMNIRNPFCGFRGRGRCRIFNGLRFAR